MSCYLAISQQLGMAAPRGKGIWANTNRTHSMEVGAVLTVVAQTRECLFTSGSPRKRAKACFWGSYKLDIVMVLIKSSQAFMPGPHMHT